MTDGTKKVAVLAFADTFGVVTSLLVRNETTFEQCVIRAADQWRYPPSSGTMLPPGSHHSAVVKHDFVYLYPPQFDAQGEITNAPVIDVRQISQFAARIQQRLFDERKNVPKPAVIDLLPHPASSSSLRVAARQKPRYFEREHQEKPSSSPRALHGPKKKK
jgi:hypothetical protein